MNDLHLNWDKEQELAYKTYYLLNEYMLSEKKNLEDMNLFEEDTDKNKIYSLAHKLWDLKADISKSEVKIEHDFYLKLFQLSSHNLSDKFDIVMLDEAQDSNLLTYDLVTNLGVNSIVMVGDPHQQMYAWRNAQNILKLFDGKEYTLTTSFRVSQNIANVSNYLIKDAFSEDLGMKGFNKGQKIVLSLDKDSKYAYISRTNAALFDEAIDCMESDKKIFFEGGFESYKFNNIKDAYYFYLGEPTNNPMFKKFKSYNMMKEYAEKIKDLELLSIIRALMKYGSSIPRLVNRIRDNSCSDKSKADIILTTAHKSKGETYENVKIANDYISLSDFFNRLYIQNRMNNVARAKFLKDNEEECHIIYVAITRAKGQIVLNDDMKAYLLLRDAYERTIKGEDIIDIDKVNNITISKKEVEDAIIEDKEIEKGEEKPKQMSFTMKPNNQKKQYPQNKKKYYCS